MPLDTQAAARKIVAESEPSKKLIWHFEAGIRTDSVRLDIPLRQAAEVLNILAYCEREFPLIRARIETALREGEDRALFVAGSELKAVRARVGRKRGRPS